MLAMNSIIPGTTFEVPPTPNDPWEIARWENTRFRYRLLTGQWSPDLRLYNARALGKPRAEAIGPIVETGGNLFAMTVASLSTLYTVEPIVTHADPEAARRMTQLLDGAGFASVMSEVQRLTLGLREMLVSVEVFPTGDLAAPVEIALRQVRPDLVVARPSARHPSIPMRVEEAKQIIDDTGRCVWTWSTSTADPADSRSVTGYVLYHAAIGSTLWDHTTWQELVDATMSAACNRSASVYNLRFAAYAQRYLIDAMMPSDEVESENGSPPRSVIVADPSTVLQLVRTSEGVQPTVGQWAQPFSPAEFAAAIAQQEATAVMQAGIPAADVLRMNSDSRSGVSLQIDREGKREVARRFEPTFRRGDLQLLRTIAILVNDEYGSEYLPESGWGISYQSQPPTESEIVAEQDRILGQLERGLVSEVEARAAISGETKEQAKAALDAIRAERMRGSVALTVGAQTTIVDVLSRVQSRALTAATARPILIGVLGMSPDSADEALAGVGPLAVPGGSA